MKHTLAILLVLAFRGVGHTASEAIPCPSEPTDTTIAYGNVVACSIDAPADTDVFRFQGAAGETVLINSVSGVRPCVELVAPDNSRIRACENAFSARIDTTLIQTGLHTILMSSTFNLTGSYTLLLDRVLPSPPSALPVLYGETKSGDVDPEGDLDVYTLQGSVGDAISILADSGTRPCLELVAPDNTRNRACDNAFSSRIDATLDQPGTYVILIGSTFNLTGGYTLTLQCLVGPCVVGPAPCGGDADCDDENECTVDSCEPSGCQYLPSPDDTPCDDGNGCGPDLCRAGQCMSEALCSNIEAFPAGRKPSITVTCTREEAGTRGDFCEAQGFAANPEPMGALATSVPLLAQMSDLEPVTKRVRKRFGKRGRRTTFKLRLNRVGKQLLQQATLERPLEVDVRVTLRSGGAEPSLLVRLVRLVRRR